MRLKVLIAASSTLSGILLISIHAQLRGQGQTRPRRVNDDAKPQVSRPAEANGGASTIGAPESTALRAELVTYPNDKIAFICGPQLKANSRLNPFPWFD